MWLRWAVPFVLLLLSVDAKAEEETVAADPSWPGEILSIAATLDGGVWAIATETTASEEQPALWLLDVDRLQGRVVAAPAGAVAAAVSRVWFVDDEGLATFASDRPEEQRRIALDRRPDARWMLEALSGERVALVEVGASPRAFSRVVIASADGAAEEWTLDDVTVKLARADEDGGLWLAFDAGYAHFGADGWKAWLPRSVHLPGFREMGRPPRRISGLVGLAPVGDRLFVANRRQVFRLDDEGRLATPLEREERDEDFDLVLLEPAPGALVGAPHGLVAVSKRCDQGKIQVTWYEGDGELVGLNEIRHLCTPWEPIGHQLASTGRRLWMVEPGGALLQYGVGQLPWQRALPADRVEQHVRLLADQDFGQWQDEQAARPGRGRGVAFVALSASVAALWFSLRLARRCNDGTATVCRLLGTALVTGALVVAASETAAGRTEGGPLGAFDIVGGVIAGLVAIPLAGLINLAISAYVRRSEGPYGATFSAVVATAVGLGLALAWSHFAGESLGYDPGLKTPLWIANIAFVSAVANIGFVLGGGVPRVRAPSAEDE